MTGGVSAPPAECDCQRACEIIDSLEPCCDDDRKAFERHLATCPECRAASEIEPLLRGSIAPARLPSPGSSFEADLIETLEIDQHPREVRRERWIGVGWVALAGLAALGIGLFRTELVVTFERIMLQTAGQVRIARLLGPLLEQIGSSVTFTMPSLAIFLTGLMALASAAAIGVVWKR